jgi:hypothetical protein
MVGSAGNAPARHFQFCLATPDLHSGNWITSHIDIGSGGGSCAHGGRAYEARLNLILPAVKWWSRWVTLPHQPACRAGALLVCHDPVKLAGRLGAAPSGLSFGDSVAQAGARPVGKLVRLPGVAPGLPPWRGGILAVESQPRKLKGPGAAAVCGRPQGPPGPCHFNKEQTPLASLRYQPADSRRLFRCLGAHLLRSP